MLPFSVRQVCTISLVDAVYNMLIFGYIVPTISDVRLGGLGGPHNPHYTDYPGDVNISYTASTGLIAQCDR